MGSVSQIIGEVKKVIVGKDRALLWVLTTILARGHILLEDIPGVGKTTMALAFAKALGLDHGRVPPSIKKKQAQWSISRAPS